MIIDGRAIARELEQDLKKSLLGVPQKSVVFVMFLDTPATRQFIAMKSKVAERLGINAETIECFDCTTTQEAIIRIGEISQKSYDGVVVQLPLPTDFAVEEVVNAVPADLDIDGLCRDSKFLAPVAMAVLKIFNFYQIDLAGKEIVVVGNGRLVGEPVGALLTSKAIPFGIADGDTNEIIKLELIRNADVIISGVGVPHIITPDMIKEDVVLIDAGTSEQAGKLVGDIDPACAEKASFITPVPGGVGPVTVTCLFENLI
jgi:methylenetetrahydrofolate dehydrogenase (NADP+)/methenyltetrahydrofolate cyclohydrolase